MGSSLLHHQLVLLARCSDHSANMACNVAHMPQQGDHGLRVRFSGRIFMAICLRQCCPVMGRQPSLLITPCRHRLSQACGVQALLLQSERDQHERAAEFTQRDLVALQQTLDGAQRRILGLEVAACSSAAHQQHRLLAAEEAAAAQVSFRNSMALAEACCPGHTTHLLCTCR